MFLDWYLPGYKAGGPVQSFANIVSHLTDGYYFSVVTRNTDFNSQEPYPNVRSDDWNEVGSNIRVYYLSAGNINKKTIQSFITASYDLIYLNSLYSYFFSIYPVLHSYRKGIKSVVAPRGMLGSGALQIKPLKKKLFLALSKRHPAYRNVKWQASSHLEEMEIRAVYGKNATVMVAPNLVAKKEIRFVSKRKEPHQLKLFFLSRIVPIKNLDFALEALAHVSDKYSIDFTIIGPVEDPLYWQHCQEIIGQIEYKHKHIRVTSMGEMPRQHVMEELTKQHVLLLPTRNENFGHSIMDALAASSPVIISDCTPWRNLVSESAGFDISLLLKTDFVKAIEFYAEMSEDEFKTHALGAFNKALSVYNNPEWINKTKKLFND